MKGDLKSVEYLVDAGADINKLDGGSKVSEKSILFILCTDFVCLRVTV